MTFALLELGGSGEYIPGAFFGPVCLVSVTVLANYGRYHTCGIVETKYGNNLSSTGIPERYFIIYLRIILRTDFLEVGDDSIGGL